MYGRVVVEQQHDSRGRSDHNKTLKIKSSTPEKTKQTLHKSQTMMILFTARKKTMLWQQIYNLENGTNIEGVTMSTSKEINGEWSHYIFKPTWQRSNGKRKSITARLVLYMSIISKKPSKVNYWSWKSFAWIDYSQQPLWFSTFLPRYKLHNKRNVAVSTRTCRNLRGLVYIGLMFWKWQKSRTLPRGAISSINYRLLSIQVKIIQITRFVRDLCVFMSVVYRFECLLLPTFCKHEMTRPPLFILVAVVTSHFPRLSAALGFPKCNSNHLRLNQVSLPPAACP